MKTLFIGAAVLLLSGIVFLVQKERTAQANAAFAEELMYCGAFKLLVLDRQHKGSYEEFNKEPEVVYLRLHLILTATGLGRSDVKALSIEANDRFINDIKAQLARIPQDPDALRHFFRGLDAKCTILLHSDAAHAARERGKAIGEAELKKAKKQAPTETKKP